MKFSIIMPSYLGNYANAANDRHSKIHRAIQSVFSQTHTDFELIIIADGCNDTWELINKFYSGKIEGSLIKKQPMFSGNPRNLGIKKAKGDYITYLDIDDCYGKDHLKIIHDQIQDQPEWVWFDDYRYKKVASPKITWHAYLNPCDISKKSRHGTSNICHRSNLEVLWKDSSYDHDYHFVRELMKHKNYRKINPPEYLVCHLPKVYDI